MCCRTAIDKQFDVKYIYDWRIEITELKYHRGGKMELFFFGCERRVLQMQFYHFPIFEMIFELCNNE